MMLVKKPFIFFFFIRYFVILCEVELGAMSYTVALPLSLSFLQ